MKTKRLLITNEEKAREIAARNAYNYEYEESSEVECEQSTFEMAEWKDEQFTKQKQELIDKSCEWMKDNVPHYLESYGPESSDVCIEKESLINDFRKAMEE